MDHRARGVCCTLQHQLWKTVGPFRLFSARYLYARSTLTITVAVSAIEAIDNDNLGVKESREGDRRWTVLLPTMPRRDDVHACGDQPLFHPLLHPALSYPVSGRLCTVSQLPRAVRFEGADDVARTD